MENQAIENLNWKIKFLKNLIDKNNLKAIWYSQYILNSISVNICIDFLIWVSLKPRDFKSQIRNLNLSMTFQGHVQQGIPVMELTLKRN